MIKCVIISDSNYIKYTATERLNIVMLVSKTSTSSGSEFAIAVVRGKYDVLRILSRLFLRVHNKEVLLD